AMTRPCACRRAARWLAGAGRRRLQRRPGRAGTRTSVPVCSLRSPGGRLGARDRNPRNPRRGAFRSRAARRCLVFGGAWSVFLWIFVLGLPYAVTEPLLIVIGVYALVFGILVSVAAFRLQRATPTLIGTVTQTG